MRAGVGGVVVATLLAVGCVGAEVTPIGPRRASLPLNCQVQIFPATPPPYPFSEVASARAKCHFSSGRNACIEELRKEACAAGADTIFGFSEGMKGEFTFISATLAAAEHSGAPPPYRPTPWQPAAPGADGCNPICSPGFACTAGRCVPQCNPPCEGGEVCSRNRVCEPGERKADPGKAPGASPQ
jgi:hypothetical protein